MHSHIANLLSAAKDSLKTAHQQVLEGAMQAGPNFTAENGAQKGREWLLRHHSESPEFFDVVNAALGAALSKVGLPLSTPLIPAGSVKAVVDCVIKSLDSIYGVSGQQRIRRAMLGKGFLTCIPSNVSLLSVSDFQDVQTLCYPQPVAMISAIM